MPEHSWTQRHRHVEIFNINIATFSIVYLINAYLFRLPDPVLAGYFLRVIVMPLSTVLQHLTICKTLHKRKYNRWQNLDLLQLSKVRQTTAFISQTVNITRWEDVRSRTALTAEQNHYSRKTMQEINRKSRNRFSVPSFMSVLNIFLQYFE